MTRERVGSGDLARSLELLWRDESEHPKPGPKPRLTLSQIVSTAIALADRDGIEALSMRNVATELGIGTMSLYRYVPGKGELLDLMVDQAQASGGWCRSGLGWRATLEDLAEGTWQNYSDHPWLLQVNQSRPVLGPQTLAGLDGVLETFDGLPLTDQTKISMISAVSNLVTGTAREDALYQQAAQQSGMSEEEFWKTQEPYLVRAMNSGAYPQMAKLNRDAFEVTGREIMWLGVRALLDGFQALIEESR